MYAAVYGELKKYTRTGNQEKVFCFFCAGLKNFKKAAAFFGVRLWSSAIFRLPEEKQSILIGRKADFAERAGIDL